MVGAIRILHLEDDPSDAEIIGRRLAADGLVCKITRVETGADFEEALQKQAFDVILADYRLPTFDGVSALKLDLQLCPEIPFVVVSGTLGEDAAIECLTHGATDYVTKEKLIRLTPVVRRAIDEADNLRARRKADREIALMSFALENMSEAALLIDNSGQIRSVNKEASVLLGYRRVELVRLKVSDIDSDFTGDCWFNHWTQQTALKSMTLETELIGKDGQRIHVEARANLFEYEGKSYDLWLIRDITAKKLAEQSLRRLNRELRAVGNCNQAILRSANEQDLLREICRIVCEDAGYRLAWVGYAEDDEEKTVRPVAWAGDESGYVASAKITWREGHERGEGPAGVTIRTGRTTYVQDFAEDSRMTPWRESALLRGFRSGIALPLKDQTGKVFGALLIYSTEVDAITPEEIRLMEDLSRDLAFGVTVLRARLELNRALEELSQKHLELSDMFQQLEQSRNMLRLIIESIPARVFWKDLDSQYMGGNTLFVKDAGLRSGAELIGKNDYEMPWKDYANQFRTDDHQVMESAMPKLNILGLLTTGCGNRIWASTSKVPLQKTNGAVFGILGIYEDITSRKEADEKLQKLSHVVEQSPVSVVVTDTTGSIEYVNPKFSEVTGYSREEILGKNPRVLKSGLMAPSLYVDLWNTISGSRDWRGELCNRRKDGSIYWELAVISPLVDQTGKTTNYIAIKEDITLRKHMEDDLRESIREKDVLLSEVHHRVKNNLQIISSLLNLESGKYMDSSVRGAFEVSQRRVRAIAQVHERLFASENVAEIDLGEQLFQLAQELETGYGREGITVVFDVERCLIPIDLAVPCGLIANELITNAFKHAFPGNRFGTITIRLHHIGSSSVEFAVCDDGIGSTNLSSDTEMSKLGLILVKNLAEQISADLKIDISHGSCITVIIPCHGGDSGAQ
jgi:PAS domain S-box-containing protein